jgi:hypothetical protein
VVARKRKLIVRDWMFYVVWYVRLKKILKNLYSTDMLQQELDSNKKYQEIVKLLEQKPSDIRNSML